VAGVPPAADLDHERRLCAFLKEAASMRLLASAHDLAEGGLACALAECCISRPDGPIGAEVSNPFPESVRPDFALFSENQGRVLLSCDPGDAGALAEAAARYHIRMDRIGTVGGESISIGDTARINAAETHRAWREGFAAALGFGE
jgi:phosphoribosylformylglycinamidine synthase